jgi:transcriptional regulator with XRE-family HTH domain
MEMSMLHAPPGPEHVDEADRLRRLRQTLGFSQRELADEFGVAHGAVGLWETGKRTIPGPVRRLMTIYEQELGLRSGGAGRFSPLPRSRASRSLKLSSAVSALAARAVISRLAQEFEDHHLASHLAGRLQVAMAQQVVKTMGEAKGVVMKLGQMLYQPFCGAEPYRFTPQWLADTWRAVWLGNRNRFRTALPRHWLFLPRLQWGLYAILAQLDVSADWRGKLLDLVYPPGAPRPPPYTAAEMTLAAGLSP